MHRHYHMRVKNLMTRDERNSRQDWLYQTTNTLFVAFGQPFITQRRSRIDALHHSWNKIMYIKRTGIMFCVWWNSTRTSPRYWDQGFLSAANLFSSSLIPELPARKHNNEMYMKRVNEIKEHEKNTSYIHSAIRGCRCKNSFLLRHHDRRDAGNTFFVGLWHL